MAASEREKQTLNEEAVRKKKVIEELKADPELLKHRQILALYADSILQGWE